MMYMYRGDNCNLATIILALKAIYYLHCNLWGISLRIEHIPYSEKYLTSRLLKEYLTVLQGRILPTRKKYKIVKPTEFEDKLHQEICLDYQDRKAKAFP